MYVAGYGSDAVFRVQFNSDGSLNRVGSNTASFIELGNPIIAGNAGQDPIGIGITYAHGGALVANEATQNVSAITFSTQAVLASAQSAPMPTPSSDADVIRLGKRFFTTGTARWSLKGQAWNSCQSCHPDGLTDHITWYFGRGPRQTTSLDGTFAKSNPGDQRILNWTSVFDEVSDFELNTRGNSGGVGALVIANSTPPAPGDRIAFDGTDAGGAVTTNRDDGLNGGTRQIADPTSSFTPHSIHTDWLQIERYVQTIRSPRGAVGLSAAAVDAGAQVFAQNNCAGCHGGPKWTVSQRFYTPNDTNGSNLADAGTTALINAPWSSTTGFPASVLPQTANRTLRLSPYDNLNDQAVCVLRNVGTFPSQSGGANTQAVSVTPGLVLEVRANMTSLAQGATGYNPPSLLGMIQGGPYFHGGNALTLDEVFGATFAAHHQAFSSNFDPTSGSGLTDKANLIQYLISLDNSTPAVAIPAAIPFNPIICPPSF